MTPRLHLALMGIDGAGKSTIAAELAESLRRQGRTVEIVSFRRAMVGVDPSVRGVLAHVAFASLQCQYADAIPVDRGVDLGSLLSEDDFGPLFPEAERRLRLVPIERNVARPFLSSALLEIVGGLWVHSYIESRLRAGICIIDESFAFKHVLKNVLLAQRMAVPGSPVRVAAQRVLHTARSLFGDVMQPTHGYWVDTAPCLALRWRRLAGEPTTPFENYGLMGETGDASFMAMQEDCRLAFRNITRIWSWQRIPMCDLPQDENVRRATRAIERTALAPPTATRHLAADARTVDDRGSAPHR